MFPETLLAFAESPCHRMFNMQVVSAISSTPKYVAGESFRVQISSLFVASTLHENKNCPINLKKSILF